MNIIHCDLLVSALIVHVWIQEVHFLYMGESQVYGMWKKKETNEASTANRFV